MNTLCVNGHSDQLFAVGEEADRFERSLCMTSEQYGAVERFVPAELEIEYLELVDVCLLQLVLRLCQ